MISLGKNITAQNGQLRKVHPDRLFQMISHSDQELVSMIHQLRTLLTISPERYAIMKRRLPYITCGNFHPPYRKTENFNFIKYFVLDVDHLGEKNMEPAVVKQRLFIDNRVMMIFLSPSADGLKIMLELSDKCFDAAKYSLFYKVFAREFSKQHGLDQVIDSRTSDVTRACFLSDDPEALYRPKHQTVNMKSFIEFEDQLHTGLIEKQLKKEEKEQEAEPSIDEPDQKLPLSDDVFQEIKQKLNPRVKTRLEKKYYVPEELDKLIPLIEEKVREHNIRIREVQGIHYGKKIVFELKTYWAEINVFYGKRGFSAVKTPKRGSNQELAEIVYRIICEIIYGTQ